MEIYIPGACCPWEGLCPLPKANDYLWHTLQGKQLNFLFLFRFSFFLCFHFNLYSVPVRVPVLPCTGDSTEEHNRTKQAKKKKITIQKLGD